MNLILRFARTKMTYKVDIEPEAGVLNDKSEYIGLNINGL